MKSVVGLVIVSHSSLVAEGVKEMALQMAGNVNIEVAGGTNDSRIGSDINKILKAINNVYNDDGVVILFDLGSSLMNVEMARDFLPTYKRRKVLIIDAPLVEGSILAAIECSLDKKLDEIKFKIENMSKNKIN